MQADWRFVARHPIVVRYQAALRSDMTLILLLSCGKLNQH